MSDKCGTEAGYQRHRKAAEAACGGCKKAHAASVTATRKRNGYARERLYRRARERALQRIADRYREEFETELLDQLTLLSDEARAKEAS